jgi:ER-bound oxygenase mpaB/B'/Rubber oxygenase, catalytic domain
MPTAFRYPDVNARRARFRGLVKRLTGVDVFPADAVARAFVGGLNQGDPLAERFVAGTYHGELGARKARVFVEKAQREGIDNVPDAPESMRALFDEFELLPDWVDTDLVEEGAAVWRRWAYALGALGNAGTNDTYTEGWLAVPLSLSGGYAGQRALHRYLETSRWWIEVCRPGAVLTPGSLGRNISLHVRIMHVSVRDRVKQHPEWDAGRWGLPVAVRAAGNPVVALAISAHPHARGCASRLFRSRPPMAAVQPQTVGELAAVAVGRQGGLIRSCRPTTALSDVQRLS